MEELKLFLLPEHMSSLPAAKSECGVAVAIAEKSLSLPGKISDETDMLVVDARKQRD